MSGSPVFVVTGASSGIGAATARQAAQAGHRVVLAARSSERIAALAGEIGGLAVPTDVTRWEDNEALVKAALDAYVDDTGVRVTSIEPGMVDTPFFDLVRSTAQAG